MVRGIVDGNGDHFDTGFLYEVDVIVVKGIEFADARLAPGGPKADNHRMAIVL